MWVTLIRVRLDLNIGHINLVHIDVGHVNLGHVNLGHVNLGHVNLSHVDLGHVNPLPPSDAVRKQKKNILEDRFSSVLSQFKKYRPSGNLKFNNLGIFQSLKLRILMEKILQFLQS